MFIAKSGFVIPRNKLSGSLVPVFRGGKKPGGSDVANDESTKQAPRKTKWGPDLTQDSTVRRGRALAYETRVEQITKLLKSRILENGGNQDVSLLAGDPDKESFGNGISDEKALEHERQELIGEILKLNPSYKTPADYKPVLKESKVPIPVKEYPGHDFIGLICGPGGDTLKRLEKETGAAVQIHGTKAGTGAKRKISPSDMNEKHATYQELYVHVSADTFEKVDAAVALIELLVTPISGTPAAVSATTTSTPTQGLDAHAQGQDTTSSALCPVPPVSSLGLVQPVTGPSQEHSQAVAQSVVGSAQDLSQAQFLPQTRPWMPRGPPSFVYSPIPSSVPVTNTTAHPNTRPSFVTPPGLVPPSGFLHNQTLVPPRMQQPMPGVHHQFFQSVPPQPPTTGQPVVTGLPPNSRPLMPPLPPLTSSGWSQTSGVILRPPLFQPHSVAPRSLAIPSGSAPDVVPPMSFPFQPSGSLPLSNSVAQSAAASVSSTPALPNPVPVMPMPPAVPNASSASSVLGSTPIPLPVASTQSGIPVTVSGVPPGFAPIKPPSVAAQKPHHPSSADFTFQPPRAQTPVAQGHPSLMHGAPPAVRPALPAPAPAPAAPQLPFQAFPRQHVPFAGNPNPALLRPRFPSFPVGVGVRTPGLAPQMPNVSAPFLPQPGNPGQFPQNYRPMFRPENSVASNQQWSNNPLFLSGKSASGPAPAQHVYDPFSPTVLPHGSQQAGADAGKAGKPESDPEYEDLMASVGVR